MPHNHFANKTINLATHNQNPISLSFSSPSPMATPTPKSLFPSLPLSQNPQTHPSLSSKTIFSSPQIPPSLLTPPTKMEDNTDEESRYNGLCSLFHAPLTIGFPCYGFCDEQKETNLLVRKEIDLTDLLKV